MASTNVKDAIEGLTILVADSNAYTRKLTRSMLINLGAKSIYEAPDGVAALDSIRSINPDVMILNWDMPGLDGPEVMRVVRSPEVFPKASLPVIMLTDRGSRSVVRDAVRLGVHELLVTPISPKALQQRLLGILLYPRPMVQAGKYFIPLPRRAVDRNEFNLAA